MVDVMPEAMAVVASWQTQARKRERNARKENKTEKEKNNNKVLSYSDI
jgi:hypothetical protein